MIQDCVVVYQLHVFCQFGICCVLDSCKRQRVLIISCTFCYTVYSCHIIYSCTDQCPGNGHCGNQARCGCTVHYRRSARELAENDHTTDAAATTTAASTDSGSAVIIVATSVFMFHHQETCFDFGVWLINKYPNWLIWSDEVIFLTCLVPVISQCSTAVRTVVRTTQQVNGKWPFSGCQNSVTPEPID